MRGTGRYMMEIICKSEELVGAEGDHVNSELNIWVREAMLSFLILPLFEIHIKNHNSCNLIYFNIRVCLLNSMAYGTRRFNAAFTMAL